MFSSIAARFSAVVDMTAATLLNTTAITTAAAQHISAALPAPIRDDPLVLKSFVCLGVFFILWCCYRWYFGNYIKPPQPQQWTPNSEQFYRARRETYASLPPYPNGWYRLCELSDLDGGRIHTVSALGLNLIVYKSEKSGRPVVMDAFCPHLGAHLGAGGKVCGDAVICPFHEWRLNSRGDVEDIPYSPGSAMIGKKVTRTYDYKLWHGLVLFWFHEANHDPSNNNDSALVVPPEYDLNPLFLRDDPAGYEHFITQASIYKQHVSEPSQNSPDSAHFNTLHRTLGLPWWISWLTDRILSVHHVLHQYLEEGEGLDESPGQRLWFDERATVHVCGIPLPYEQLTTVEFQSAACISFHIRTPIGNVQLVKTLLPLDHYLQSVEDRWFKSYWMPRFAAHAIASVAAAALEQDREVWENKIYRTPGLLVRGDGPFPAWRQWYSKFYSDGSEEYAAANRVGRVKSVF